MILTFQYKYLITSLTTPPQVRWEYIRPHAHTPDVSSLCRKIDDATRESPPTRMMLWGISFTREEFMEMDVDGE